MKTEYRFVFDTNVSVLHIVTKPITLCRDPKDDKFLSLAHSAEATCIISGGLDLLVLANTFGKPILSPADFLLQYSNS